MDFFFTVKLGLTGLTSKALVEKGRNCVDMLTGNVAFTFPAGFLASITTACTALEQADQEVLFNGGKLTYQAKRAAEKELQDLIRELAGFIQAQAQGEEAKILSAGFEVRRQGKPVVYLDMPQGLRYIATTNQGQVRLRFDVTKDAIFYHIMVNSFGPDQADKWELVGVTSATKFILDGQESNKPLWFRVQAFGRRGLSSTYSQPVRAAVA